MKAIESTMSPKYKIVNLDDIHIIQQYNDTIIIENKNKIHNYFKQCPNIKCIYGDMMIDYDGHVLYKPMPSFEINFIASNNWEPVLFYHTIKPDLSECNGLVETTQKILQHTFIHHIPVPLSTRKYE